MSDNKWTPEPWPESKELEGYFYLTEADYVRARECVNALAGEENPERFVKLKWDYEKELFDIRYLLKAPHEKTTLEAVKEMMKQREELAEQVRKLEVIVRSNLDLLNNPR